MNSFYSLGGFFVQELLGLDTRLVFCRAGLVFWPVSGTVVLCAALKLYFSRLAHYKGNNNNSCTYHTEDLTEGQGVKRT